MKQVFKIAALALCSVSLMTSCCKKKGNEPMPNPNPPVNPPAPNPLPNPVDNTKSITLTLAAGQTAFSLSALDGENITIEGVSVAKEVTPWKYADKKKVDYTATGSSVVIKGNIKELAISAGQFDKLDLSVTPTTLESLLVVGAKVKSFDFTNAQSLKSLVLNNPGMSGTYNLSHTNLQSVQFTGTGANFTLPQSVKSIYLNKPAGSGNGITNNLTLAALPNLESFYVFGDLLSKDVDFSGSTKLVNFVAVRSQLPSVNLSNCKALKTAGFADPNGIKSINLSGCIALVEGAWNGLTKSNGFFIKQNENRQKVEELNLSGTAITKFEHDTISEAIGLKTIDLSKTKLTKANFSKFTALKELNLLNNPTLTGAELTAALNTLPATQGKIKIANLSAGDAAVVAAKGWTVAQ